MKVRFDIQQSPQQPFTTQTHHISNVGTWETTKNWERSNWNYGVWFEDFKYGTIRYYVDTDIAKQKEQVVRDGYNNILFYLPEVIRMYREQLLDELL